MSLENRAVAPQRAGFLTVGLCCLVAVLEGFDLQAAGVSAPRLSQALGLTSAQLGWFFSSSTFGLILGAAIGGRLSDRFGRKMALLASVMMFGVLSIVTGMAGNEHQLLAARFLTGVGLGGALPNIIALVAENMPLNRRSWAIGLLYGGMPTGGAVASLTSLVGAAPADWRTIFFIGGIAPLAALPLLASLLTGNALPARRVSSPRTKTAGTGFLRAVFGEQRAARSAILWVGFFLALSIMYLLLSWLPSLLISRGLTRGDAAIVQTAFNIFGAGGSVLTGWLMDQSRWRTMVAVGVFTATALTIASVAAAPSSLITWLLVGGALGATVSGCQATLYGLAPSCYPMAVRGTGVGVAVAVGRCGAATGPLLAGQMLTAGFSANQVMLTLLPIVAVAGIATTILSLRPAVEQ